MIRHPFEFILEKFIRPNGLTQKQLWQNTGIGIKTLSELYGAKRNLTPLTALKLGRYFGISPHLLMAKQTEWDLAEAASQYKSEIEGVLPFTNEKEASGGSGSEKKPKLSFPRLLNTLNTSIGDRQKHLTRRELVRLFHTSRITPKKAYAIRTLFSEASVQEIIDFVKAEGIEPAQIRHLYHLYLKKLGGKRNSDAEWLIADL